MKKYDWKNEYNPIRRTAKRLLSGEPLSDGRPLSDLIELDEHARKCLAFEATLTDRQIDMLQELGYLPVITRQYGRNVRTAPTRWTSVSMAFADDALFSRSKEDAHAVHPSTD
ncbi:hypothetical protein SAMN02745178_02473 [Gemmiger formicilis]|uniref:Uncharacterized protein n=1 Tax=Gemmiger formicilis TaxID=745368 RepID=A0A1T4XYM7_9FIRM|nr:hypothetical protein [Gemmiger formicilis]SKA94155.1 hypothetical protein SAMN02745178_02473 [Gemmiger formicilis]